MFILNITKSIIKTKNITFKCILRQEKHFQNHHIFYIYKILIQALIFPKILLKSINPFDK